jgi:RNA polymerase sigma-70 factor (ECF subfamily)
MDENYDAREKTDEELVVESLVNPDVFATIIYRYEKQLLRYIRRISGVPIEDAQDILQESFLRVYRNLNDFDASLTFSSWIYRIVYNATVSVYRKCKSRPEGNRVDVDDDVLHRIAGNENILESVEQDDIARRVRLVIDTLPEKYHEVIVLYYFEEKTYREISDILRKPEGSVATLLSRAKRRLRKMLV